MPPRRFALALSVLSAALACAPAGQASITSFSPTTGPMGITITIVGANLGDVSAATIGGVSAQVIDVTASRVVLRVPDDALTGQITLSTGGSMVTSRLRFVVAAGIANTEPSPGPPAVATSMGYSLLSMYPLLLQEGRVESHVYLVLVANASVTESAHVLQALGLRHALNLDGGGTSAMWLGSYKVGPGRLLPNAVLLMRS